MLPGVLELELGFYNTIHYCVHVHSIHQDTLIHSQKAWDQKGLGKGEGLVSSCTQLQMYIAHSYNQRSGQSVE